MALSNAFGLPHTADSQPMPNPSAAKRTRSDSDPLTRPIALSEPQMSALLAAAYPLPPDVRSAFLEACAKEIAALPELGDGALHRTIVRVQKMYFDPPDIDSRMPRVSKWER
jgi:hypothetical protein